MELLHHCARWSESAACSPTSVSAPIHDLSSGPNLTQVPFTHDERVPPFFTERRRSHVLGFEYVRGLCEPAEHITKILHGARPSELPLRCFELVTNSRTAMAIGLAASSRASTECHAVRM
jgi:hypothetical protein